MKDVSADYTAQEEATKRKPVEFYHIWKNDGGDDRYYTSGDVVVNFEGHDYFPATLKRSLVRYDTQLEVTKCTVQAAFAEDPLLEYIAINPVEIYWIKITKLHRDQVPLEADVIFLGQIKGVAFKGVQADVECVGFEHFLRMPIPTERYQITCNWQVFDAKCRGLTSSSVNRARSGNMATVETLINHELIAGNWVTVSGIGGTGYNGTWQVSSVPDGKHFVYTNTGGDEAETVDTGGTVVRDMKESYKTTTIVTLDATKTVLTAAAFGLEPAGYFIGGLIEFPFENEKRTIVDHSGNTITMAYRMIHLENGDMVDVYPGCDGRAETCRDKFDNILNSLGFPYIPIENPAMRT